MVNTASVSCLKEFEIDEFTDLLLGPKGETSSSASIKSMYSTVQQWFTSVPTPSTLSFWEKANQKRDTCITHLMQSAILPSLKIMYHALGQGVGSVSGAFDPSLKEKVLTRWKTPFSLEFCHGVSHMAKRVLEIFVERRPTNIPGLHFLDQSVISMAQSLYPYVKGTEYLLSIPQTLKNTVSYLTMDKYFLKLSSRVGFAAKAISRLILLAKKVFLLVLNLLFKVVDAFLKKITGSSKVCVFGYLKAILKETRSSIHEKFADVAIKAIDSRSEQILGSMTPIIAESVTDYVGTIFVRVGLNVALASTFFAALHYPSLQAIAAIALAPVFVSEVAKPYFEPYYTSYRGDFKISESYLKQFCNYFPSIQPEYWKLKIVRALT